MTFGATIRELRKQSGRYQREIATQAGISDTYLGQMEREACSPPSEHIVQQLAQVLDADEAWLLALADAERPPKRKYIPSAEARRKNGLAHKGKFVSLETRQKLRLSHLGKKDSPETRAKKLANLERIRQRKLEEAKLKYTYTECDFCGKLGPEEEKTSIRYEEEESTFGLCPDCFAAWKRKPDEAVIVKAAQGQEKTA